MKIETVTLKTATGDLFGTLELPTQTPPIPVALIIAGSGPTDRDGNSAGLPGKNDSLKSAALPPAPPPKQTKPIFDLKP